MSKLTSDKLTGLIMSKPEMKRKFERSYLLESLQNGESVIELTDEQKEKLDRLVEERLKHILETDEKLRKLWDGVTA